MGIELKQKGEIYIIAVNEQFAVKDPMKAKDLFERLFKEKVEYGNLKQLEKEVKQEKEKEEMKEMLGKVGDVVEAIKQGGIQNG